MKLVIYFFLITLSFLSSLSNPIIIDHSGIKKFDDIPEAKLSELAKLKVMFRHASVGTTIDNALDCLQGTRNNPAECKTYPQYKYDRRNFKCQPRGNSGWYGKVDDFLSEVENQLNDFDIFSFKYCYLDGLDGLQEPCGKDFKTVQKAWDYLRDRMEFIEKKHPDKTFVWWTIPLTQVGQLCTDTLNNYIRQYVKSNNKVLFDIADIQCHDEQENYVLNTRGWEIAYKPFCGEQQPGAQACHPNWTGSIRIAKAFWYLIYSISDRPLDIEHCNDKQNYISLDLTSDNILRIHHEQLKIQISEILIYNTLGDIINKFSYNNLINNVGQFEIDLSSFQSGIYFVRINSRNSVYLKKFVLLK